MVCGQVRRSRNPPTWAPWAKLGPAPSLLFLQPVLGRQARTDCESAGRLSDHMGRQPEPGRGPGVLPGQRDKAGSMAHVSAPPQGAQPHPGACMELAVLKLQALPSPSFRAGAGRRPSTWRPEEKEVALSPGSVAGEK